MFGWLYKTITIDSYNCYATQPLALVTRFVRRNSTTGALVEERFAIKLPCWNYYYDIVTDSYRWGQLWFSWSTVNGKPYTCPIFPTEA